MALRIRSNNIGRLVGAGYTLIELLVIFTILGLVIALSENSLHLYLSQIEVQNTSTAYVQMLRRAQSLAISGKADSPWGVTIATSSITLFKGVSYAARDVNYDEVYTAGATYTLNGITEVDFARFTGLPNTYGTTTIDSPTLGTTTLGTIYINAKGTVSY